MDLIDLSDHQIIVLFRTKHLLLVHVFAFYTILYILFYVSNDTQKQKNLIIKVSKQIIIQINVFIFSKNLHIRKVPSSNTELDILKSRNSIKSWVHCCFCVRYYVRFRKKKDPYCQRSQSYFFKLKFGTNGFKYKKTLSVNQAKNYLRQLSKTMCEFFKKLNCL